MTVCVGGGKQIHHFPNYRWCQLLAQGEEEEISFKLHGLQGSGRDMGFLGTFSSPKGPGTKRSMTPCEPLLSASDQSPAMLSAQRETLGIKRVLTTWSLGGDSHEGQSGAVLRCTAHELEP